MSDCRSSGYSHLQCNQSQKMSVGMAVNLANKPNSQSTKTAEVSIKHFKREISGQECARDNVGEDFQSFKTINACDDHVQDRSAVVQIGQVGADPQMKGNDHIDKQASQLYMIGFHDMQTSQSFNLFPSQAALQPVDGVETSSSIFRKEGKKDGTTEKYSDFPRGDKQETCTRVKGMLQKESDEIKSRSKETLRMKLQEILGTVPSANKKYHDSRMDEAGDNKLVQEQTDQGDASMKHKQNSDTIETDSEKLDGTTRRPITRSQTRKRAPARTRSMNFKMTSLSNGKEEHQDAYVFSFAETSVPSKSCEENLFYLRPGKLESCKQSCGIKPVDLMDHVADSFNTQRVLTGNNLQPREEPSLDGRMIFLRHGFLHENLEPEAAVENKILNYSLVSRGNDEPQDGGFPILSHVSDHHKSMRSQSPAHHDVDLSCPLYNKTKDVHISSLSHNVHRFVQAEGGKAAGQFRCSPATEGNTGSSDDAATLEETCATIPETSTAEKAKNGLFSHEREEFDSSEEVFSTKKVYPEDVLTSPETMVVGQPMLFQTNRHCHDVKHSTSSPTLTSPKAYVNIDDELMEPMEGIPEDEFARVVSLLGLALERVKNKMTSMTNKRCLDILMSAADGVHLQLCNVESQIQTDLDKLTSLNGSKRKHVETTLQERQEQLKVIHDKLKKEIHQYIEDCRSAAKVLEAQHIELKGAIERQNTLHGKLLLQAEAAVNAQLNNARRQMVSIHELGRQKRLKLKVAIAECLKDGISS